MRSATPRTAALQHTAVGAAQLARHTPEESTAEKEEEEGEENPLERDTHDEFMSLLLGSKKRV